MPSAQTGYADVNGAHLYYEVAGTGETVTLLHAGIADTRMWDDQFDKLSQRYRVIRYDLRGFGKSTAPDGQSFTQHADLHDLLGQLGVERTALIGCSNGGRVAMDYTLTYPDQVSALVMVCSTPGGYQPQGEPPPLLQKLIQAQQQGDLEGMARAAVLVWGVGENRQPEQVDQHVRNLIYQMSLVGFQKYAQVANEQHLDPPAIGRLSEIGVYTLIIDGAEDYPTTHAAGEQMEREIAGARRVVIQDAAHLPSLERPAEVTATLSEFLSSVLND